MTSDVQGRAGRQTPEAAARSMLVRMGVSSAKHWPAGNVTELANLIALVQQLEAERDELRRQHKHFDKMGYVALLHERDEAIGRAATYEAGIARLEQDCRHHAIVAGQASVEGPNNEAAQLAAREAARWLDTAAALAAFRAGDRGMRCVDCEGCPMCAAPYIDKAGDPQA